MVERGRSAVFLQKYISLFGRLTQVAQHLEATQLCVTRSYTLCKERPILNKMENYEAVMQDGELTYHNGRLIIKNTEGALFHALLVQSNSDTWQVQDIQPMNATSSPSEPLPGSSMIAASSEMTKTQSDEVHWSDDQTKLFLSIYMEIKNDHSVKYKSKSKQWADVSAKMLEHGYIVSPVQCRNRYATLERAYKRVVDHNGRTGRNRVKMAASDEVKKMLTDILGCKENVHLPEVINHRTVKPHMVLHNALEEEDVDDPDEVEATPQLQVSSPDPTVTPTPTTSESSTPTTSEKATKRQRKKPTIVIELAKLREQQKVMAEKKLEKLQQITEESKRSNDLLEEHNKIFKAFLERL